MLLLGLLHPPVHKVSPADGCTVSTTALAFFPYDPSTPTPSYGLGAIQFTSCSGTASVALSAGDGTYALREMQGPVDQLGYNIYTDFTFSTVWGDGTSGTSTVSVNTGSSALVPVPGRIPASENASAGNYADTVIVTVSF